MLALLLAVATDCGTAGAVEHVEIVRHEIFEDDRAASWPLRLLNRLHPVTREAVIRRELLFEPGACADAESLAQTERNLRRLAFLRDARVETVPSRTGASDAVDVRVSTFDAWTTVPLLRLAKVGNRRVWTLGVVERNVFGRGLQVGVVRRADFERDQTIVGFREPRLFGSRVQARASYADRSDGSRTDLEVGRPFFALDTKWAYQARLEAFHQVDPLYEAAERVGNLPHSAHSLELRAARMVRRTEAGAVRLSLAYRRSQDTVAADVRRFGVVEASVSLEEHRFLRLTHVNRFEAAEDFNLGHQLAASAALSEAALGGEGGSTLFLAATERKGLALGDQRFVLGRLAWSGRHRHGRWENAVGEAQLDGFTRLGGRAVALARAEYRHGRRLDPEVQMTLGAQNGLRGYPVNQWVGTRSLLLATESRLFVADDVGQLASLALAAFAEAGYAWPETRPVALRDLRGDVGLGVLIGRNRLSTSHRAIRFDLAYAFNPPPGRGRWVLSAGLEARFLN